MNQITNSTFNSYLQHQLAIKDTAKQEEDFGGQDKKLLIEMAPGEHNISEGDKSQNTVRISIQGPSSELSVELSREQLLEKLRTRFYKQAIGYHGSDFNSLVKQAVVLDNLDVSTAESIIQAKQNQRNMNTYFNSADESNVINLPDSTPASKYIEYRNQMLKQKIFLSNVSKSVVDAKV